MAAASVRAKENRRSLGAESSVDYPFLILVLLALAVGLTMLYSASFAQMDKVSLDMTIKATREIAQYNCVSPYFHLYNMIISL